MGSGGGALGVRNLCVSLSVCPTSSGSAGSGSKGPQRRRHRPGTLQGPGCPAGSGGGGEKEAVAEWEEVGKEEEEEEEEEKKEEEEEEEERLKEEEEAKEEEKKPQRAPRERVS